MVLSGVCDEKSDMDYLLAGSLRWEIEDRVPRGSPMVVKNYRRHQLSHNFAF
jgi:hypothetical protein